MNLNVPPITILMSVGLGMSLAHGSVCKIERFSFSKVTTAINRAEDHKVCTECGLSKPIGSFPRKSAKNEFTVRLDKRCRLCKSRTMTRTRTRPVTQADRAKEIIEPRKLVREPVKPAIFESKRVVDIANFDDLNRFYDIKMTDREKYEVVQGFNEFVSILREGLGEEIRCGVYVKAE